MEVKNCVKCKKLFQYLSGPPLCPNCKDQEEKDFQAVRQYLKEHPRATISEVAETLEISVEKITRFLKDGRLEVAPGSTMLLECERCGVPISTGRFCAVCSGKLESDLSATSRELHDKAKQAPQSLMKYLKKD